MILLVEKSTNHRDIDKEILLMILVIREGLLIEGNGVFSKEINFHSYLVTRTRDIIEGC